MLASETEPTLEWTFQYRLGKEAWAFGCLQQFVFVCLVLLVVVPPVVLTVKPGEKLPLPPSPHELLGFWYTGALILFAVILWLIGRLVGPNKTPGRTLRINRREITLTDTNLFRIKERRINLTGAKVRAVCFDFLERCFTVDGKEQKQIVEQIQQRMDGVTFEF